MDVGVPYCQLGSIFHDSGAELAKNRRGRYDLLILCVLPAFEDIVWNRRDVSQITTWIGREREGRSTWVIDRPSVFVVSFIVVIAR